MRRKRATSPNNPLVIQPSTWTPAQRASFMLFPPWRSHQRWYERFHALAKSLDMRVTEYVTEAEHPNTGDMFEKASLTYTAFKPGLRITLELVLQKQWKALKGYALGSVAWGSGEIPALPDETEGPFVLPLGPMPNSTRFKMSGAPRYERLVPPDLGPRLDAEWRSDLTTLYRSAEFTLVRQTFSLHVGWRTPLVGKFFRGGIELSEVQRRVEALGLPERVRLAQIPRWWFDPKFERRFVGLGLVWLLVLQLGVIVYGIVDAVLN